MLDIPPWDPADTEAVWILVLFMLGYSFYYFFAESPRWRSYFAKSRGGEGRHPLWSRYLGGLLIGILPAAIMLVLKQMDLGRYGLKAEFDLVSLGWIVGLAVIIIPMNFFNTPRKTTFDRIGQYRLIISSIIIA